MSAETRAALFRQRDVEDGADDVSAVTPIELFYDLVFVFAITQLSKRLLSHLTVLGALETLILFLAVWWLWIYTSWATNWLDPERGPVRFLLIAMMFGGLVMASSLLTAFGVGGGAFAASYVAMQLVRTGAIVWAARGHDDARTRNFLRIGFYFMLSAPFWMIGATTEHAPRLGLWAVALAIEYLGPSLNFRTPGLGRATASNWDISGRHMAERCSLFIIIALGEAVLVTGATFAALAPEPAAIAAFAVSFTGSAAMWWIYFDIGAKRGNAAIEHAADAGRLARSAYTYMHMPIVAGIIVTAAGDQLMLGAPYAPPSLAFVMVTCGGPLLFLIGNQAFKWMTADRAWPPLSHFGGETLLIAVAGASVLLAWPPLAIGVAATGALLSTAAWEWFSLNGGWQRWLPWMAGTRKIAPDDAAG